MLDEPVDMRDPDQASGNNKYDSQIMVNANLKNNQSINAL